MSGLDPDKMKLICKGHVIDDGECWFSFDKYATSFTQKRKLLSHLLCLEQLKVIADTQNVVLTFEPVDEILEHNCWPLLVNHS